MSGPGSRRAARVLAGLLLAAALVSLAPGAEAATSRTLVITAAVAQPQTPFKGFDGNPPKAFDIDGDGRMEILAQNDNQRLYVFRSDTGARLAELMTTFPSGWGARSFNGPEAYRGDDGVTRIVVANSAAYITSFRYDAASSNANSFRFVKEWERRTTDCFSNPGMDAKPTLADLDKDGSLEILVGTEENGVVALRANGALYWKKCIGGGNGEPTVGDLNLDGWPDVVHASDGGVVTAMNGRTGATMWTYHVPSHFNIGNGAMPIGPAIGQIDGIGGLDVVVGVRDAHDHQNFDNNHALLLALSTGGKLLWGLQDPHANPLTYTHPIIADADRDGRNEIYWGDWNTMGHKPPYDESQAWQVTGPANYYRVDHTGKVVWRVELGSFWSNKDLALADVDGDGQQEVLVNGPNGGHDGIWYLNSATGAKEAFVDLYPWMMSRGPVLYDLDGDGGMKVVVETGPMATSQGPAVMVFDTNVPFNALWPHLPAPGASTAPPPPPPPPGDFDATFRGVAGNQWWIQAEVLGNGHAVTAVDASVNGGAWRPLAKQSWGPDWWAASFQINDGSTVQLRATASGATDASACYRWIPPSGQTAATVACSGTTTSTTTTSTTTSTTTTTSSGTLQATFTVPGNVNEWWVEVRVQANQPLQSVEAKAGSGAWTALAATDWGTWAKSFHVPAGTPVQFRATSTTGATATSQTFTWLGGSSGEFTASFTPKAVGNDWWIEVDVGASKALAKVEASRDGGAWVALDKQSWGSWAKSLHTPNGTQVTFRATSTDGEMATSAPVTWT